jgi:branched-chain amino acid transport system ATP-binding protein
MTSLLFIESLFVNHGPISALGGVSLEVNTGEVVALLGVNGAGKSTLLQAVMGIVRIAAGSIFFDGYNITREPPETVVTRGIALAPEGRRVFSRLLVAENLRLGAGFIDHKTYTSRLDDLMEIFPALKKKLRSYAGTLSGGQQQQLAIARALMRRPRLLLLDEPSLGLAPRITSEIFDLIRRLADGGTTILLVEQNVERAIKLADRGYVLSNGRVVLEGKASELPLVDIEKAYLGLSNKRVNDVFC